MNTKGIKKQMSKCRLSYKIITIGLALYGVKCLVLKGLDKLDERSVIKEQEKKLKDTVLSTDEAFSEWTNPSNKSIKEISGAEKYLAKRLKEKLDDINT